MASGDALREEMGALDAALQGEMARLDAGLRGEMAGLETRLGDRMNRLETRLLRWSFAFWVTQLLALGALLYTLFTLAHP